MDYKEKYEQAFEKAKEVYNRKDATDGGKLILESMFPELKESEDEEKPNGGIMLEDFNEGEGFYKVNLAYLNKEQVEEIEELVKKWNPELAESEDESIRKEILYVIHQLDDNTTICGRNYDFQKWIAWLEKHKYTEDDLDNAYKCADEVQYRRGYEDAKKELEKQGEQKPAWSEEDEMMLENAISSINHDSVMDGLKSRRISYSIDSSVHLMRNLIHWLESLKYRMKGE